MMKRFEMLKRQNSYFSTSNLKTALLFPTLGTIKCHLQREPRAIHDMPAKVAQHNVYRLMAVARVDARHSQIPLRIDLERTESAAPVAALQSLKRQLQHQRETLPAIRNSMKHRKSTDKRKFYR